MVFSHLANQTQPFNLIELPFVLESQEGFALSNTSFDYHYYKHHQTYLKNLNNILAKTEAYIDMNLEEVIECAYKAKDWAAFNNSAQVWNHNFFWHSITPDPNEQLLPLLNANDSKSVNMHNRLESVKSTAQSLIEYFGSSASFLEQFKAAALGQFGSGWVWLVEKVKVTPAQPVETSAREFEIIKTSNAFNPISINLDLKANNSDIHLRPMLCCDVWEHAYYIDYYNDRAAFIDGFFKIMRLN